MYVMRSEEHPIRQRVAALVAAWNRGDLRTFAGSFASDAEYITGDGEWIRGSRAIEDRFVREFRKPVLMEVDEISVRVLSDTAALAHLVWSSAKRHGVLTAVFAAPDWKIVSLQNTDRATSDAT
jgi:uncharacterized protein (TIGR02246 family)